MGVKETQSKKGETKEFKSFYLQKEGMFETSTTAHFNFTKRMQYLSFGTVPKKISTFLKQISLPGILNKLSYP